MSNGVYAGMNNPALDVVCDAGPLIHLEELNNLSLLADFSNVFVPDQVWSEVEHHRPSALTNPDLSLQKVPVDISSQPAFHTLFRALSLGLGEQAALLLMQRYPQAIFLTDDAAARLAATTLGYRVHGSIGILLRAVRRRQRTRDEIIAILRNLSTQSTLHIRSSLLQEIITRLENQF
jgi:predicted nucleic acid-binding protein